MRVGTGGWWRRPRRSRRIARSGIRRASNGSGILLLAFGRFANVRGRGAEHDCFAFRALPLGLNGTVPHFLMNLFVEFLLERKHTRDVSVGLEWCHGLVLVSDAKEKFVGSAFFVAFTRVECA